jgi:membrane associated rhomboid family serine protease
MLLNVAAFIAQVATGGTVFDTTHSSLTTRFETTTAVFKLQGPFPTIAAGDWYRLFTGGFLHANLLHLGVNMLVLWLVGPTLERALGPIRYTALYAVSLVGGSVAVVLVGQSNIGASGAICGLLAATVVYQRSRHITLAQSGVVIWIVLILVSSFAPGISLAGHVGGLLTGGVAGWLLFDLERRRLPDWLGLVLMVGLLFLLLTVGVAATHHYAATGHAVL